MGSGIFSIWVEAGGDPRSDLVLVISGSSPVFKDGQNELRAGMSTQNAVNLAQALYDAVLALSMKPPG